jgi:polysaccharide chain length determinant protein (PEP-CTERM system associated)
VKRSSQNFDPALDVWSRRKWPALLVFAAVAGGAASLALSLPNLYRAAATVLVERQQVSEAFVRPSVTAELETRLQTIREDVMSRSRLSELITRFDLYPELHQKAPSEALVARMRRDIDLELKGVDSMMSGRTSTIAFTISYGGNDPGTVAKVANALADMYVRENTRIREGQATRTAQFMKAELAEVKKELDVSDRRANDFRMSHLGELPQQVETNLASLERLNTQLRLNGENQIRALDRRERIERQRADGAAMPSPAASSPDAERLARLRQQLDDLRSRFTEAYPDVVRVRADVDALTRQMALHPETDRHAAASSELVPRLTESIADVDTELRALKDEERVLRQTIAGYEQRVENVPKRQQEFQEISRDYETTKERYDSLLKRYEEAQLAERLEQGQSVEQFRILDPALPPRDPIAPNRPRLLVFGLLLAFGLAIGVVMAVEKLDTAFHRVEDLRAFVNAPMLGRVPFIASAAETRRNRRRAALATVSAIVAVLLIVAGSRYVALGNEQIVRLMERSRG